MNPVNRYLASNPEDNWYKLAQRSGLSPMTLYKIAVSGKTRVLQPQTMAKLVAATGGRIKLAELQEWNQAQAG